MSTPDYLAHLATGPRRQALRIIDRTRLANTVERTGHERTAARKVAHWLNQQIDATRAELDKVNSHSLLYPPSEEIDAQRAQLANEYARLIREHRHASALRAAADVVHESAVLERAWAHRPDPSETDGQLFANVLLPAVGRFVKDRGYSVTVLHPDLYVRGHQLWREVHHATVRRSRARAVLETWAEQEQAYILRDPHGRFYVATPTVRLELVPTDIALPLTEGAALRAALDVYGFPSYDDTEGGVTWLAVPQEERNASHEETYAGPHFRISSGERADRPASQHNERWGASLFGADGAHITTFDGSPDGSTLAEDCAYIARAIAEYVPAQH
ncbi:hypothetical protein ABT169_17425 [Streptomyces sp. NPDC001616]|uniref:hypothetical protein n=1 Tax=Streptomyces sp. NPDC001616 TaxID=3156648 RepID=UPI00332AEA8D